jgi:predicted nucleotidyltransferase
MGLYTFSILQLGNGNTNLTERRKWKVFFAQTIYITKTEMINPALISFLVHHSDANSIILFGSVARGDEDQFSDIDLLILSRSIEAKNEYLFEHKIRSKIPESLLPKEKWLSLAVYFKDDFEEMHSRGSLFMAHILREGVVLYDDGFYQQLTKRGFHLSEDELRLSLRILSDRLDVATDLEKFGNYYIRCLSNFFTISTNLVINALALHGQLVFSKKQAFSQLASVYPKYEKKLNRLFELQPFFVRNSKGLDVALPFEPYNCEKEVIQLRDDIRQLLLEVARN